MVFVPKEGLPVEHGLLGPGLQQELAAHRYLARTSGQQATDEVFALVASSCTVKIVLS